MGIVVEIYARACDENSSREWPTCFLKVFVRATAWFVFIRFWLLLLWFYRAFPFL
jgi:hypothetical protein